MSEPRAADVTPAAPDAPNSAASPAPRRISRPVGIGAAEAAAVPLRRLLPNPRLLAVLFAFRLLSAMFVLRTSEAPDEYWQGPEVAYHVVFGRGEITWEWREGIRSFLYPLPFAIAFKVLQILGLDSPWAVWAATRAVAGATLFAIDLAACVVAAKRLTPSRRAVNLTLMLLTSNWAMLYAGARSYTNVVEALCLTLAFIPLSWPVFLVLGGVGCGLRVTFALPLLPLALGKLMTAVNEATDAEEAKVREEEAKLRDALKDVVPEGASDSGAKADGKAGVPVGQAADSNPPVKTKLTKEQMDAALKRYHQRNSNRGQRAGSKRFAIMVAQALAAVAATFYGLAVVDRLFYGRLICTPLRFLWFNVFKGLSALFGTHPWWMYGPFLFFYIAPSALVPLAVGGWRMLTQSDARAYTTYLMAVSDASGVIAFMQDYEAELRGEKKLPPPNDPAVKPEELRSRRAKAYTLAKRVADNAEAFKAMALSPHQHAAGVRHRRSFAWSVLWVSIATIGAYSALPHKEMRFIFPLVPPLLVAAAGAWAASPQLLRYEKLLTVATYAVNCALMGFFCMTFQRGGLDMMALLRDLPDDAMPPSLAAERAVVSAKSTTAGLTSAEAHLAAITDAPFRVDVLTSCFSTPGYSHVHGAVQELRIINCSTEVDRDKRLVPKEHHLFLQYPVNFVRWAYLGEPPETESAALKRMRDNAPDLPNYTDVIGPVEDMPMSMIQALPDGGSWPLPHAIVVFTKYARRINRPFLKPKGFKRVRRLAHAPQAHDLDSDSEIELWVR